MQAADELGIMIEVEAPFCWAGGNVGSAALNYTVQAHTEMILFNRHHASVVAWSLGNESPWNTNFNLSYYHFVVNVDSTRPFMFDGGSGQKVRLCSHEIMCASLAVVMVVVV
jgi:beta-galactosidase